MFKLKESFSEAIWCGISVGKDKLKPNSIFLVSNFKIDAGYTFSVPFQSSLKFSIYYLSIPNVNILKVQKLLTPLTLCINSKTI